MVLLNEEVYVYIMECVLFLLVIVEQKYGEIKVWIA
jgi:hypothetical protein